jgi:O-antigen/teichoic acid export membrane protein
MSDRRGVGHLRGAAGRTLDGKVTSVLRGGVGYLAGEAGSRAITFALLIGIAPMMPTESFAYVSLYVAFANISALIFGLGVQNAIVRFHFRSVSFAETLGTGLAIIAAMSVVGVAIGLAMGPAIASVLGVPDFVVATAFLGGVAIAVRASFMASLRARRLARLHAVTQLSETVLVALAIGVLIVVGRLTYESVISSLLLATVTIAVWAPISWARNPGLAFSAGRVRELLSFSGPMIFHGLALHVMGAYGQIAVNAQVGSVEAGVYAYAYRFGMAMVVLSTAFSAAWMPAFLESVRSEEGRAGLGRQATVYLALMIVAATAMMFGLPIVAWCLGGSEYRGGVQLVPIVVYAYLWYVMYTLVLGYHIHAGRTTLLAGVSLVAMGVNVLATNYLLGAFGLVGAAVASVVGYASLFAFQYLLVRFESRRHGEEIDIRYGRLAALVAALVVVPVGIWAALSVVQAPLF